MKINNLLLVSSFSVLIACSNSKVRTPAMEASTIVPATIRMDIERLKLEAFSLCQKQFIRPTPPPVPILDPPKEGGADTEGMVYQEELAVRTTNFLDRDGFYFSPRPRAAVNTIPMEIFVDNDKSGFYQRKTWNEANPDYSANSIQPPIDKNKIPVEGRVLTELIIGHRSPQGDYPQLFDLRSSAYVRFAGYPPQITGASLRLGAHNIFGLNGTKEDFPVLRSIFVGLKNEKTANALVLLESDLFCGALNMEMTEGENAEILVDSFWYTREDFYWKKEPHTGLVAYSSMLWKTEKHTPENSTDEAHDSDVLTIKYANNLSERYPLDPPATKIRVRDLTASSKNKSKDKAPIEWILANEDRDPSHYSTFAPALQSTNYNFRVSYSVALLGGNIKTGVSLYEQAADGEYGDNIVAVSTIRQNIKKAIRADQFVRFTYKTTAFYPEEDRK